MAELPTRDQLRSQIRALDSIEKKVLGGLIVLMIRNHDRVKDSEWIYESLVRLSVPALNLDQEGEVDEDMDRVQGFVQASGHRRRTRTPGNHRPRARPRTMIPGQLPPRARPRAMIPSPASPLLPPRRALGR